MNTDFEIVDGICSFENLPIDQDRISISIGTFIR